MEINSNGCFPGGICFMKFQTSVSFYMLLHRFVGTVITKSLLPFFSYIFQLGVTGVFEMGNPRPQSGIAGGDSDYFTLHPGRIFILRVKTSYEIP